MQFVVSQGNAHKSSFSKSQTERFEQLYPQSQWLLFLWVFFLFSFSFLLLFLLSFSFSLLFLLLILSLSFPSPHASFPAILGFNSVSFHQTWLIWLTTSWLQFPPLDAPAWFSMGIVTAATKPEATTTTRPTVNDRSQQLQQCHQSMTATGEIYNIRDLI